MRQRPWEIPLLTVLYLAAPLLNLSYTCLVRGYELTALPDLVRALAPLEAGILLLYPILAAAVWSVSLPGWWIFVALNLIILIHNVWVGLLVPGAHPLVVVAAGSINVALAALLFTKHARSPYFSPRDRWWNVPDRYQVSSVLEVPVTVRQGGSGGTGQLVDVGPTGCLIETLVALDMDQPVDLAFECWGLTLTAHGKLIRRADGNGTPPGYGILFIPAGSGEKRTMLALVNTLRAHRVPVRGAD